MKRCILAALLVLACLTSCEQIELAKTDGSTGDDSNQSTQITAPLRTGEGTMDAPYTVDELKTAALDDGTIVWVIGYAVGTAYSGMNNAVFLPPFEHDSNILLASRVDCTNTAECVPVRLNNDKTKEGLSLKSDESRYQQCVMIHGSVGRYLSTTGITSIVSNSEYKWFEGFIIPMSKPSEWETDTIHYSID